MTDESLTGTLLRLVINPRLEVIMERRDFLTKISTGVIALGCGLFAGIGSRIEARQDKRQERRKERQECRKGRRQC